MSADLETGGVGCVSSSNFRNQLAGGLTLVDLNQDSFDTESPLAIQLSAYDISSTLEMEFEYLDSSTTIVHVTDFQVMQVANAFLYYNGLEEELEVNTAYAIERILSRAQLSKDDFTTSATFGYYGEEEGEATLDRQFVKRIEPQLEAIEASDGSIGAIAKLLLVEENGHLLDGLENVEYRIERLDLGQINVPSSVRASSLDQKAVGDYAKMMGYVHAWEAHPSAGARLRDDVRCRMPVGIVTERNGGFRLIDGYHRYAACQQAGREFSVPYIVAKLD